MKTYVFDAGALLAYLEDGPGAAQVEEILAEAHRKRSRVLLSALNFGEVYGKILRDRGRDKGLQAVSGVSALPIELQDVTPQRALRAAEVKATYKLYYVDAFAASLALEEKATLVTSDSDFRKLGHSFPVLWLKN